jgi:adenosylcobinamide-phosphate synthase
MLLGEPPNRWHPVAWMGSAIGLARKHAPEGGCANQLIYGALVSPGGALLIYNIGALIRSICRKLPAPLNWLAEAFILKTTFSLRGLNQAARDVENALQADDIPAARRVLSWHLVSRDTATLDASQVAAAAVESVAENTSDGIIAPLFYYILAGLPGALAYRYVNTVDSMLGYRDAEREYLGKIPARFDDLANLIPARLMALLFIAAAFILGENGRNAWRVWRRDGKKTASPNAGQPMSAMAGALGVELEKVDHYVLGVGGRLPSANDIRRARLLMFVTVAIIEVLSSLFSRGRHDSTPSTDFDRARGRSRRI